MIVFRLCNIKYSNDLSGIGAAKHGGRWNSKGNAMLYTSQSRALAVTELAVHIPLGIIPPKMKMVSIEIPDRIDFYEIKFSVLPAGWRKFPHIRATKIIGDAWLAENKYLVLKVPSAVVQSDFNFVINPEHKDFSLIKVLEIEDFRFDNRLFE